MKIPFVKMHGTGNDFILMHRRDLTESVIGEHLSQNVCHRHFGVGADGLMIAEDSFYANHKMTYYNSDGSLGEMCGNGIRCFARFVTRGASTAEGSITIETMAGVKRIQLFPMNERSSRVTVNMGKPEIHKLNEHLCIHGTEYHYQFVVTGVPHVVIFMDEADPHIVERVGPSIETHCAFPAGTNVNFCHLEGPQAMKVWTWERGAGHTLACGTGVTSASAAASALALVGNQIQVEVEGGRLHLFQNQNGEWEMTGPAEDICTGVYDYEL